MAASSRDDIPTQLAALLGKEVTQIRKTSENPTRVSIIDAIMAVSGGAGSTMLPGTCAASPINTPKWGQIGPTSNSKAEGSGTLQ